MVLNVRLKEPTKNDEMTDVTVHVEAFKGKSGVIRTDVRSFIVKISQNDNADKPTDLLSTEDSWKAERIMVRTWGGPLPSEKDKERTTKERKTFS